MKASPIEIVRSLRRYRETVWLASSGAAGDGFYSVLRYAIRFVRLLVLLSVWEVVFASRDLAGVAALGTVQTYTLVAGAFGTFLDARTDLGEAIWDGRIATWFVAPVPVFGHAIAVMMGRWIPSFGAFTLPVLFAAPLIGVDARPASLVAGMLFVPSLACSVTIGLAVDLLLASLMVATGWSVWDMQRLRTAFGTLLTGAVIPLAFFPWGLGAILAWTPLAAMASAPLRIYTGDGDAWNLMAGQVVWVVVMGGASIAIWSRMRERLVGYGG